MSDTMTVQVICPLTKLPYSCEGVNHEVCPGGKEIVLRRWKGSLDYLEMWNDLARADRLWVEADDDTV